jgi:hypothetical protein
MILISFVGTGSEGQWIVFVEFVEKLLLALSFKVNRVVSRDRTEKCDFYNCLFTVVNGPNPGLLTTLGFKAALLDYQNGGRKFLSKVGKTVISTVKAHTRVRGYHQE